MASLHPAAGAPATFNHRVFSATHNPFLNADTAPAAVALAPVNRNAALAARGIELRQDRVVIVEASGVTFRLAGIEKPESVPRVLLGGADRSAITTLGTAAILQGLLVASLAYLTPSLAWGDDDELDRD